MDPADKIIAPNKKKLAENKNIGKIEEGFTLFIRSDGPGLNIS